MNKIIELSLANQIVNLAKKNPDYDYVVYSSQKDKIIEDRAISSIDMIKEIISFGVSPLTVINYEDNVNFLISHVFSCAYDNTIKEYFISILTKEDISKLNINQIDKLYENSDQNKNFIEKLFKNGFNFNQGSFNEIDKALNGDIDFFEICLNYKKDFTLNFKYDDLFLDEHLKEDIDCLKKLNQSSSTLENNEKLLMFLSKTREIQTLKENLNSELKINVPLKNISLKI